MRRTVPPGLNALPVLNGSNENSFSSLSVAVMSFTEKPENDSTVVESTVAVTRTS